MMTVRQKFPASTPIDIPATVKQEFAKIQSRLKPGMRIAVAVGSRGITNLQAAVMALLDALKAAGAQPFIVPAMGSHGGATPEGQAEILAEYGISEATLNVPVKASLEVERLGASDDGIDVFFSTEALRAEGVVVVNRVKPHTDFNGTIGSGILKMLVIGLGKRAGAANFHAAASRLGYERVIRSSARVAWRSAPILCGVALVENQLHETARIAVIEPGELERREEELFAEAKRLMPRLPFAEIDLLIVDRIGKNISGAGMDPNIIGRGKRDYPSVVDEQNDAPIIRQIFARDLTPETHGNAIGIGCADYTTARLVRGMDKKATYINALTSLAPHAAKIPIYFDTDREVIAQALSASALADVRQAKVVRITDTLSLEHLEVSEAFVELIASQENLVRLSRPQEMEFDDTGNLLPLGSAAADSVERTP